MEERITGDNLGDWYYSANPYFQRGYGLPNCTAYVWGRLSELTGQSCTVQRGNAIDWAFKPEMKKIDNPTMGCVIIYSGGIRDSYGRLCGHIGVVEHLYSDGSIDVSMSSYGGYTWRIYSLKPSDGYHIPDSYNLTFYGFYMYDGVQRVIEQEQMEREQREIEKQMKRDLFKKQFEQSVEERTVQPRGILKNLEQEHDIPKMEIPHFPLDSAIFVLLFLILIGKKIIKKTTVDN